MRLQVRIESGHSDRSDPIITVTLEIRYRRIHHESLRQHQRISSDFISTLLEKNYYFIHTLLLKHRPNQRRVEMLPPDHQTLEPSNLQPAHSLETPTASHPSSKSSPNNSRVLSSSSRFHNTPPPPGGRPLSNHFISRTFLQRASRNMSS